MNLCCYDEMIQLLLLATGNGSEEVHLVWASRKPLPDYPVKDVVVFVICAVQSLFCPTKKAFFLLNEDVKFLEHILTDILRHGGLGGFCISW